MAFVLAVATMIMALASLIPPQDAVDPWNPSEATPAPRRDRETPSFIPHHGPIGTLV